MQGGLTVPGYTLVRRLDDSGAQATVHLGRSILPPHHEAAIKIYHSSLRTGRDRQRFQREVEAMQRLAGDPHIIDVYETGVLDNGQAYLAMRLCSGGSLANLVTENGPLSPAAVASLGETIAETLGRAHRMGVLHRDVKPHNILLGDDGFPVLADFGIVALQQHDLAMTATGRWTASYAAPELFRDEPATVRSDVYGLGATLYALLSGRPPHHDRFRNPSPAELLTRRSSSPERIDGVPDGLMNVLLRALSPEPTERFATAGAFAAALRESGKAQPPPPPRPDPVKVLHLPDVDPRRPVTMRPGIQPGLLATAAIGTAIVGFLGMQLASPSWMFWWMALTALVGLASAVGGRVLGFLAFSAGMSLAFVVAVRTYDESPLGSLGWVLAACLVGITAGAWGHSTSAVRLRWFAWRQRLKRRRWWGQASTRAELTSLEVLPAARFLRMAEGTCHYAVVCGEAVALVRWASWSHGRYIVTDEEVRRDGGEWGQGSNELARARRGLAVLQESEVDAGIRRRVFLAVDTPSALRCRELRGDLTVCHTRELAETLGKWLAQDPYHLDLELLTLMLPLAEKG